jgi:hypothetical protein
LLVDGEEELDSCLGLGGDDQRDAEFDKDLIGRKLRETEVFDELAEQAAELRCEARVLNKLSLPDEH